MATIESYTDLQQSKKLAEFLPLESADMMWTYDFTVNDINGINVISNTLKLEEKDVPAWSLASLLGVLPKIHKLKPILDLEENSIQYSGIDLYVVADNPVDACVDMIEKLNELKML